MFNEVFSGFSKFFTPQRVFILVIFLTLTWLLLSYSDAKTLSLDGMDTGSNVAVDTSNVAAATSTDAAVASNSASTGAAGAVASPADLLPADQNSQWAALNPVNMSQGNIIAGDMLQAGYHIGLDTIGQTLKNANLQLRSDPIIPKQNVGPWNQSTYEPDYARVPLEIGACSA
jgi:hypothetical protein